MLTQRRLTLDPAIISVIRASWKDLEPIATTLPRHFYDNLFTADPSLVPLFKSNQQGEMEEQGQKLMHMLGFAVNELDELDDLRPVLQRLGRRHASYGVKTDHYQTVGAALLQTLAQELGDRFTEPVEQAWAAAYDLMASIMLSGADIESASPPS